MKWVTNLAHQWKWKKKKKAKKAILSKVQENFTTKYEIQHIHGYDQLFWHEKQEQNEKNIW